ncbi:hypothetical protein GCM10020229_39530 [Kitasatospora albolonga]|uniref:helix-turn-helix domain-containing protein n=1 Tax=Kitasatospora albolonga TaxID=68173 RepID=UPI0031EFAF09
MIENAPRGTTSSALARLNVDGARRLGVPVEGYARLVGLDPEHLHDDLCRPPTTTSIRIAELMTVRAPWTEVARVLARESEVGSLGVWDYLITSAPTPLEGLRDAVRYLGAVLDTGTDGVEVTENGSQVTLTHVNRADMSHEGAAAVRAGALALFQQRLSAAARRALVPVHVTLSTTAPGRHRELAELYGTRSIEFEAPVGSMTFLAADLNSPTPHAQPGLSAVLRRHAEQNIAGAVAVHGWLDLFHAALGAVAADTEAAPTLALVARRLNLSPRTLQRRLDDHGTTWTAEVEDLRRADVVRLLRRTDLGIDAVAARSGYADARALRRAVRRWYGTTPAALRAAPPGRPLGRAR